MATVVVRNLSEHARDALKARAAAHNRSMEAEARLILTQSVEPTYDPVADWLETAARVRDLGGIEPDEWLPPRTLARSFGFEDD